MARRPIPQSAASTVPKEKVPVSADIDYAGSHPCWRISNFDKDGPWGINSLIQFSFQYTEDILQIIADSNMDELSNAFDEIDKAISNYLKSTAVNNSFHPAFKKLGMLFMARGDKEDAIEYFEDYINFDIPEEEKENIRKLILRIK